MQPICKLYEGWQRYEDETGGCAGTKRFRLKNSIIAQHLKAHFSHSQLLLIRRFSWSCTTWATEATTTDDDDACVSFSSFSLSLSLLRRSAMKLPSSNNNIIMRNRRMNYVLEHTYSLFLFFFFFRLGCLVDHHRSGRVRESVVHKWKMELCCWRRSLLLYCCCRHRQNLAIEVCASHAIK